MSTLPKDFDGDAFISYAHLDNIGMVEGRKGWVAKLHHALEVRIGQLLGKSPHIWRDPKLNGNDVPQTTLSEKLKHVAVLVTVVSPRYISSEWTMWELREFMTAAQAQGGILVGGKARVFSVLKTPVPLEKLPPELRMVLGYEFFRIEPETGKVRELDEVFGNELEFFTRLNDLAHDIVWLLQAIEPGPEKPPASSRGPVTNEPSKGTVYLAETTSDLRDRADQLRRDLLQHGYSVLPAAPLPHIAGEAEAAIRAGLARSQLSIHLIGRNYSLVPEGGQLSLIELQHKLATERSSDQGFQRLAWVPFGQQTTDERQKNVIKTIAGDPTGDTRADFLETIFEDLRTVVMERLARAQKVEAPPDAPGASVPMLYLISDQRDAETIQPWADALFEQKIEVARPLFDGTELELREYQEENLRLCDGVVIFYGSANELWLQRKLREVQKAKGYGRTKPKPPIAVCLIGEQTAAKTRFRSHDAVVVPQWNGVALDPLGPFLTRLKAGSPG
jgi:hypothetical protein